MKQLSISIIFIVNISLARTFSVLNGENEDIVDILYAYGIILLILDFTFQQNISL